MAASSSTGSERLAALSPLLRMDEDGCEVRLKDVALLLLVGGGAHLCDHAEWVELLAGSNTPVQHRADSADPADKILKALQDAVHPHKLALHHSTPSTTAAGRTSNEGWVKHRHDQNRGAGAHVRRTPDGPRTLRTPSSPSSQRTRHASGAERPRSCPRTVPPSRGAGFWHGTKFAVRTTVTGVRIACRADLELWEGTPLTLSWTPATPQHIFRADMRSQHPRVLHFIDASGHSQPRTERTTFVTEALEALARSPLAQQPPATCALLTLAHAALGEGGGE